MRESWDAQRFESLKPPYQANMIALRSSLNRELRAIVADFNRELERYPNIRLQYSEAFAQVDLSNIELIHPTDGQHLSAKGHNIAGGASLCRNRTELEFSGNSRRSLCRESDQQAALIAFC